MSTKVSFIYIISIYIAFFISIIGVILFPSKKKVELRLFALFSSALITIIICFMYQHFIYTTLGLKSGLNYIYFALPINLKFLNLKGYILFNGYAVMACYRSSHFLIVATWLNSGLVDLENLYFKWMLLVWYLFHFYLFFSLFVLAPKIF